MLPNLKSAIKLELFYGVPLEKLFPTLYQTLRREVRRRRRSLKPARDHLAAIDTPASGRGRRILALDPWTKAIGLAVFKGEHMLDCGVRYLDGPLPDRLLQNGFDVIKEVFRLYRPQLLILPDLTRYPGRRRSQYVRAFCQRLKVHARNHHCRVIEIDATRIGLKFLANPRASRQAIAMAVARQYPELERLAPRPRKAWQSQDLRLSAFYAVALALALRHRTTDDGEMSKISPR